MIETARDLLVIYGFAFTTGWGSYRLIVPAYLKRRLLCPLLIPGLGLAQLAIVAAYCIALETSMRVALLVTAAIGAGAALLAFCLRPHRPISLARLQRAVRTIDRGRFVISCAGTVIFIAMLGGVLSPILSANMATTPYRIGIDQVGYAEAGQYLLEGGTLSAIRARLLSELATEHLAVAERQNYKDIRYETYVDSEFLLKASRWGYPGALAALTILTGSEHVFRIEYLLLVFGYALSLGFVYYFARYAMKMPRAFSFFVMSAVGLNCNLLNVYLEGQYAQVFAGPAFLALLAIYLRARQWKARSVSLRTLLTTFGAYVLFTATLFSSFNESLVLIVALIVVTTTLDALLYRRINGFSLAVVALGSLVGAALVWPLSHAWVGYSIANLAGLSRAGFWQPHWASLAEMLGFSNMYGTPGYTLLARSQTNAVLNLAISVVAAGLMARLLLRAPVLDRSFWLAPLVLLVGEYVKSRYLDDILNYPYMKVYTLLIPLLAVLAFSAMRDFATRMGAMFRFGQYAALVCAMAIGATYLSTYVASAHTVTPEMLSLYARDRRFDRYAFLTNHQDIEQYMYVPLLSMHWLDETASQKYLAADLQRPVLMIVRTADVPCRRCVATYFGGHIVYEDRTQLFIDTGLTVADLCDPALRGQRVDALGSSDSQKQWVDSVRLPGGAFTYRPCDYAYPLKLLARSQSSG